MSEPVSGVAVLQPARIGAAGEALRRRSDRRHLLTAVAVALLFHFLLVFAFWLVDRLGVQDIGEWSGPVLVKIGVPDAAESPAPDPGPLPDQSETPLEDIPEESAAESLPAESTPVQPEAADTGDLPATPADSKPAPASDRVVEDSSASESAAPESRPAPAPVPSRVSGSESGNNYVMDFDGSEGEVGRAGAYEYITSYMPLPEVIPSELMDGIVGTKTMTPDFIRSELESYWEPVYGEFVKKPSNAGVVPFKDRPYYWSLLTNYLNYDLADADWKSAGMRPVVVEFTVSLSEGDEGAVLDNFKMKSRTNDPRVDEAVIYGLSRWVYYNKTNSPVRGRITYNFDR
jgi:hypothetical protein